MHLIPTTPTPSTGNTHMEVQKYLLQLLHEISVSLACGHGSAATTRSKPHIYLTRCKTTTKNAKEKVSQHSIKVNSRSFFSKASSRHQTHENPLPHRPRFGPTLLLHPSVGYQCRIRVDRTLKRGSAGCSSATTWLSFEGIHSIPIQRLLSIGVCHSLT